MPSNKIKQIELNGVTYDINDPGALRLGSGSGGDANEIVVLSDSSGEVIASGSTLEDIYERIDEATVVENVYDGEWIINIVNDNGTIDMSNYYSKSKVDELIAGVREDIPTLVQSDWNQSDSSADDYIKNKPSVPTKVSDLPNDAGYITSSAVKYTEISEGIHYTGEQIIAMYNNNIPICVSGNPVIFAYQLSSGSRNTVVIYLRKSINPNDTSISGIYPYYTLCYGSVAANGGSATWGATITNFVTLGKDIIKNDATALVSGKAVYEYLVGNYYTKSDVNDLISGIQSVTIQIVQTLPVSGSSNIIYFVPKTGSTNDTYDEYMWISNAWEHVGSTEVDLTGYATQTWVQNQGYITSSGVRYLEVKNSDSTYLLNYTGEQIYNNYTAGIPMCFGGAPIINAYTYTQNSTDYVAFWFLNKGDSVTGVRAYSVAASSDSGNWASVVADFSKMNQGEVVSGNGSFVTGGQVYTALAGKANTGDIPSSGSIASGDTGYATGGDVYTALSSKANTTDIPSAGTISSGSSGYATGGDVYAALEDKADTSDVPVAGTIAEGETGYATGGDVFTAINIPDLEIVELCAESPFSNMVAIGDDYLGTDSDTVLSL